MRKLYPFLTGLLLASTVLSSHARTWTPDVANFTFVVNPATSNVAFTNTSTIGSEPGERRALWSFGDGSSQWTGGLAGTEHHYQAAGSYTVCLKIYRISSNTGDSIVSSEICKTVVIESVCQANFETVSSTSNPLGKYFVAQPSHSQNKKPVYICWTFGDSHDTCIQYSTTYTGAYGVYHLYGQPGTYNVCVTIHYDGGCEAHNCHNIETGSPVDSCRANFETLAYSSTTLVRSFIAQPWHNHNKKPLRVCWTFGDNHDTCIQYSTSYTGNYAVSHAYSQPGTYNVCVNILYDGGCEAHNCHNIQIGQPDSCRAEFERIPPTANDQLFAGFRALPWHNHDKKPVRICWGFGDNTDTCINYGADYNGPYVVTHHYQQPGQYQVCVKILYNGGCEARICKPVTIGQTTCSVTIFPITPSVNSLSRLFYAFTSSAPNHPVERICWNFGDGSDTCIVAGSSTTASLFIQHTFPGPGVYHTCARVLFQGGCVAEQCVEVVIRGSTHLCGGYMTDSLIAPHSFKFRAFAVHAPNDPVLSYKWTFGDGSTGVGQEIVHSYNAAGEYRVCLTILTQSGCETRVCNTVRVIGGNNPFTLQLSPNPVITTLHALFLSTHNETVTIKIINSSGVVVRTYTRAATQGVNNWEFDLANLAPGPYLFTVQSPNQSASAIFLKQ